MFTRPFLPLWLEPSVNFFDTVLHTDNTRTNLFWFNSFRNWSQSQRLGQFRALRSTCGLCHRSRPEDRRRPGRVCPPDLPLFQCDSGQRRGWDHRFGSLSRIGPKQCNRVTQSEKSNVFPGFSATQTSSAASAAVGRELAGGKASHGGHGGGTDWGN